MDNRKKTHLALVDQGLISAVNFGTGLLLARFLGMAGYGEFVLTYGIILFVAGIQMAFVISPMMTSGPTRPEKEKAAYYRSIIIQQLGFGLFTICLTFLCCKILDHAFPQWNLDKILWPLCFAMFTFLAQDFSRRLFFVRNESFNAFVCDLISYGLQATTLIIYSLNFELTAPIALWIIGATSALATIYAIGTYLISESWVTPAKDYIKQQILEHWHIGKWLIGQTLVYWAGAQFILYIAAAFISVSAVGAIAAARNIVGLVNILFAALENLVPSRAALALQNQGNIGLSRYLKRVSLIGGLLTLAIAGLASLTPELWLNLLYGDEYTGYGWVVIAWSLYFLTGFFHRPLSAGLRAMNQTKYIFISNLFGTLFALSASYPAIKISGISGVMFTLCITQAIILGLLYWYYRSLIHDHNQTS